MVKLLELKEIYGKTELLKSITEFLLVYVVLAEPIYLLVFAILGKIHEAGIAIVFPFGSYYMLYGATYYQQMFAYVVVNCYFLLIGTLLIWKYKRKLGAFLCSFRVFAEALPVIGIFIVNGKITLGLWPMNIGTELIINAPSAMYWWFAVFSSLIFTFNAIVLQVWVYTEFKLLRLFVWAMGTLYSIPALLFIIIVHEMGHAFFAMAFGIPIVAFGLTPVGAFVQLPHWSSFPEVNVLIAGGGNIFVTVLIFLTLKRKGLFWKMIRVLGSYLTILNAIPVIALVISSYGIQFGLIPYTDGSVIFIASFYPYFSIFAFILAFMITYVLIDFNTYVLVKEMLRYKTKGQRSGVEIRLTEFLI